MLFVVIFSVVTTFSNFQATFPLISPKVFGILTSNFATKSEKYDLIFGTKIRVGLKNWMGRGKNDVEDHVRQVQFLKALHEGS